MRTIWIPIKKMCQIHAGDELLDEFDEHFEDFEDFDSVDADREDVDQEDVEDVDHMGVVMDADLDVGTEDKDLFVVK